MLDAYIIDAIQKEEEARQQAEDEGRRIWLEIPEIPRDPPREDHDSEEDHRNPIVIPLYPNEDAA